MSSSGGSGGSAIGALIFVIGLLILFAVFFTTFLIIPFFIFLAGIVAMIVSDRKRDPGRVAADKVAQEDAKAGSDAA